MIVIEGCAGATSAMSAETTKMYTAQTSVASTDLQPLTGLIAHKNEYWITNQIHGKPTARGCEWPILGNTYHPIFSSCDL